MFKNSLFAAILLACATLRCSAPSETTAKNVPTGPDKRFAANPAIPDTAGMYAAFLRFSAQNECPTCPKPRELPAACWKLLAMAGNSDGMIPVSTSYDEDTGFKALFFKRRHGRFLFYCAEAHHLRFLDSLETTGILSDTGNQ